MEEEQQQRHHQSQGRKEKRSLIKIPSYQEVFQTQSTAQPYNPPPPPASFSQAFSFLKASEFYTPPAPPSSKPSNPPEPQASPAAAAAPPPPPSSNQSSPSFSIASTSSPSTPNRNAILVSHRQKGNPLLKHIRNARWVFADIVPDYLLGQSSCALYLSIRYHLLHPDYLYCRIRELQKNFKLRVVLCHVDVEDVAKPLLEVTRTAMLHDCTLLCGWSLEECGRYLETIKVYENKPADSIREQMDTDYLSRLTHALTSIRHVNKTDVVTLGSSFGSLACIMDASMEELARCPGIGERKVRRLYDTFHEPFRRVSTRSAIPIQEVSIEEKDAGQFSPKDDAVEVEGGKEGASKDKREFGPSVRSALTAAFAKYAEKARKRDSKGNLVEKGESSSMTSMDAATTTDMAKETNARENCGEEAKS